jgi:outer membrane protein OmpA-like peptidoglycan-associated protein
VRFGRRFGQQSLIVFGSIAALASAVALFHLVRQPPPPPPPAAMADIVVTAPDFETAGVPNVATLPSPALSVLTDVGHRHGSVRVIEVNGDGEVTVTLHDLTGRTRDGKVLKVPHREDVAITGNINNLLAFIYSTPTTRPGRSELPGLQQVHLYGDTVPVIVFSPGIDLDPRDDARRLAFDVPPTVELDYLKKQDELPDLKGRTVLYVLLPGAGDQSQLGQPQRDYVTTFWETLLGAQGAGATVTVINGTTSPSLTSAHVPTVPVPTPTPGPIRVDPPGPGKPPSCTVPGPAYFESYRATFLDRSAALKLLTTCAAKARTGQYTVCVAGHVALDADGNSPDALARGQKLALDRARAVVGVLEALGVPANAISCVQGYDADHPLVQPPTDPKNRAVLVQFIPIPNPKESNQ